MENNYIGNLALNNFFIFIYSKYKLIKIICLSHLYIINLFSFVKKNTMNYLTESTFLNRKNIIKKFTLTQKNKCQCGKTKDSNGNCDGSHANK